MGFDNGSMSLLAFFTSSNFIMELEMEVAIGVVLVLVIYPY